MIAPDEMPMDERLAEEYCRKILRINHGGRLSDAEWLAATETRRDFLNGYRAGLEAAQARIVELEGQGWEYVKRLDAAQAEIGILREALEWYASRTIYERVSQFDGDAEYVEASDMARQALQQKAVSVESGHIGTDRDTQAQHNVALARQQCHLEQRQDDLEKQAKKLSEHLREPDYE